MAVYGLSAVSRYGCVDGRVLQSFATEQDPRVKMIQVTVRSQYLLNPRVPNFSFTTLPVVEGRCMACGGSRAALAH